MKKDYSNFDKLSRREQIHQILQLLSEIRQQFGVIAEHFIKKNYDFLRMHPANIITTAKAYDWSYFYFGGIGGR